MEGALRFIFMPLIVPDTKETEMEESEAQPIAIEVAEPVPG
jgi:hypothetical protein